MTVAVDVVIVVVVLIIFAAVVVVVCVLVITFVGRRRCRWSCLLFGCCSRLLVGCWLFLSVVVVASWLLVVFASFGCWLFGWLLLLVGCRRCPLLFMLVGCFLLTVAVMVVGCLLFLLLT